MKYVFIFILLLVNITFAFTMDVSTNALNVPITSKRQIEISIYSPIDDRIVLGLVGEEPWMLLSDSQLAMKADETKNTTLHLEPRNVQPVVNKQLKIVAESAQTKQRIENLVYITLVKAEGVNVDKISVTGDLEPTGSVKIKTDIKNYDDVTKQDVKVTITVSSPSEKVYEATEIIEKLNPQNTVIIEKEFTLKKYADAGEYNVIVDVDEKTTKQKFAVLSMAVWHRDVEEKSSLLGYGKTITIENYGNERDKLTVSEDISAIEALFYYGDKPSYIIEDVYQWDLTLNPGEMVIITYIVDYTLPISFLIILLVASWLLFYRVKTVRIRKYIMQKKTIEKGEEFTVGLNIKNDIGTKVEEVIVRDLVPSVFEVKDAAGPKPIKKKSEHGTELTWKIGDLVNKEERILSYKITPIFGVSGQIFLPVTNVRFKYKGREIENKSSTSRIGIRVKREVTLENIFGRKK